MKAYKSAKLLLVFVIISAIIVAVNTFARKAIENFENNNKSNAKIIDVIIEAVPLLLTFVSLILFIIAAADVSSGKDVVGQAFRNVKVVYAVGFYFLLLAIIVAFVVRIAYILVVKEYINLSNKPVENREANMV